MYSFEVPPLYLQYEIPSAQMSKMMDSSRVDLHPHGRVPSDTLGGAQPLVLVTVDRDHVELVLHPPGEVRPRCELSFRVHANEHPLRSLTRCQFLAAALKRESAQIRRMRAKSTDWPHLQ